MAFQVVEDTLQGILRPALFQGGTAHIPGRAITGLPVKQAGIALPEPTRIMGANWTATCLITSHLVVALRGAAKFRLGNYSLLMG